RWGIRKAYALQLIKASKIANIIEDSFPELPPATFGLLLAPGVDPARLAVNERDVRAPRANRRVACLDEPVIVLVPIDARQHVLPPAAKPRQVAVVDLDDEVGDRGEDFLSPPQGGRLEPLHVDLQQVGTFAGEVVQGDAVDLE